jgi:MHS family citrate/tricarballylate:H+ symporter-like MFS transporter
MPPPPSPKARHRPFRHRSWAPLLRVTSGNFLEQFDFFLFGFYATYISKAFFPASSEFASLMLTFACSARAS